MDYTEWELRFKALGDIEELLKVAAPQYRSPLEYFNKLIKEEPNKNIAEKRLRVLEDLKVNNEEERIKLALDRIIRTRDKSLKDTDWTQLADVPLDSLEKKNYRSYRSYLRDLPKNVKSGKLEVKCMSFKEWKKWIEKVRHEPGFNSFIP